MQNQNQNKDDVLNPLIEKTREIQNFGTTIYTRSGAKNFVKLIALFFYFLEHSAFTLQNSASASAKQAENKQISSFTPMPDYEEMLSPALRQELRRFGLKVIPRRKAVPLLRHIYEETHPLCRKKMDFVDNGKDSQSQLFRVECSVF